MAWQILGFFGLDILGQVIRNGQNRRIRQHNEMIQRQQNHLVNDLTRSIGLKADKYHALDRADKFTDSKSGHLRNHGKDLNNQMLKVRDSAAKEVAEGRKNFNHLSSMIKDYV